MDKNQCDAVVNLQNLGIIHVTRNKGGKLRAEDIRDASPKVAIEFALHRTHTPVTISETSHHDDPTQVDISCLLPRDATNDHGAGCDAYKK